MQLKENSSELIIRVGHRWKLCVSMTEMATETNVRLFQANKKKEKPTPINKKLIKIINKKKEKKKTRTKYVKWQIQPEGSLQTHIHKMNLFLLKMLYFQ